jgi:hypothetical protein
VLKKKNSDGDLLLNILTKMTIEEEDITTWGEKVFHALGYLLIFSL